MRTLLHRSALGLLLAAGTSAHAADNNQAVIADLRARLQTLEQQQAALKAQLQTLAQQAAAPANTPAPSSSAMSDPKAFNPAISVILNGKLTSYSRDPAQYRIPGFQLGTDAGIAARGLGLDESELSLAGNIDDRYYGRLTTSLHNDAGETSIELEEGFIETMALPYGLNVRAGRFLSDIGYLNSKHSHTWDFADEPLVYRALLGGQYKDDGVQVRWLAPTDLLVEAGVEAFRGDGFPAAGAANRGLGTVTGFVHIGGDLNPSNSWRIGISRLSADADGREGSNGDTATQFSGSSDLNIVDFVWKWAPNGNPYRHNFTLQGEYFDRDESGTVSLDQGTRSTPYDGTQRGFYVQGVYQFMPRWRVGARYDRLLSDNHGTDPTVLADAGLLDGGHDPQRYSVMLDYSHSEFSRIRLQYNRDESQAEADNQIILQYVMSLGAHGAHSY